MTRGNRCYVCFGSYEPDFLTLPSPRLIIAVRYQRNPEHILPSYPPDYAESLEGGYPKQVYLGESSDGGYTWKHGRKETTGVFDCPGDLVLLSDGRPVLLYAHPAPDLNACETWALVSRDEGQS